MRAAFALVVLVLLVIAFAAQAPATLVDQQIAALTRDGVRLADASGTVWSGAGTLGDRRGRWRLPVAWELSAPALLRGTLRVGLLPTADSPARGLDSPARGLVIAHDDTLALTAFHLELPAAALESAWTRPPVPRLEGVIVADAPSFQTDGVRSEGTADLRWERARVGLAGIMLDLGTVEVNARPSGTGMAVALRNRGGDVALTGTARVERDAVTLDATLTPSPALPQPIAVLLRGLGPATADGGVQVTWRGRR